MQKIRILSTTINKKIKVFFFVATAKVVAGLRINFFIQNQFYITLNAMIGVMTIKETSSLTEKSQSLVLKYLYLTLQKIIL